MANGDSFLGIIVAIVGFMIVFQGMYTAIKRKAEIYLGTRSEAIPTQGKYAIMAGVGLALLGAGFALFGFTIIGMLGGYWWVSLLLVGIVLYFGTIFMDEEIRAEIHRRRRAELKFQKTGKQSSGKPRKKGIQPDVLDEEIYAIRKKKTTHYLIVALAATLLGSIGTLYLMGTFSWLDFLKITAYLLILSLACMGIIIIDRSGRGKW